MIMTKNLSKRQLILCSQLEGYSPEIKCAYLGAIHVLHTEDYCDRLIHFAHSLREIIDMLARKRQTDEEHRKSLKPKERAQLLASVIDPVGKQFYEFEPMYTQLAQQYSELNKFVHHRSKLEQKSAEERLAMVEEILLYLTRSQVEILDKMNKIISSRPSREGAMKLKSYMFRWSSHSYLLEKLPCGWLKPLNDVGFFDNPRPMSHSKAKNMFPHWIQSAYLTKCVDSMPDLVAEIILRCKFQRPEARNPVIYHDFLKCALEMSVTDMERIAQKSIDEKWYDFAYNNFIAENS